MWCIIIEYFIIFVLPLIKMSWVVVYVIVMVVAGWGALTKPYLNLWCLCVHVFLLPPPLCSEQCGMLPLVEDHISKRATTQVLTPGKEKKTLSILVCSFLLLEGGNLRFTLSLIPLRYSESFHLGVAKMSVLEPVLSTCYELMKMTSST